MIEFKLKQLSEDFTKNRIILIIIILFFRILMISRKQLKKQLKGRFRMEMKDLSLFALLRYHQINKNDP